MDSWRLLQGVKWMKHTMKCGTAANVKAQSERKVREKEKERDRTEDSDLISISNLVILQAKGFQLSK